MSHSKAFGKLAGFAPELKILCVLETGMSNHFTQSGVFIGFLTVLLFAEPIAVCLSL
mgnify:CR=1 FL=1|jgi:hypothetical protein